MKIALSAPCFITVRTSSSRLPSKCLLPFGPRSSVLQHVIRRVTWFHLNPIVCTSDKTADDQISDIAKAEGVLCYRGSDINKMDRWLCAADYYRLDYFHTIDADDLYFDAEDVRRSLAVLVARNADVVYPSDRSKEGAATVGYSIRTRALRAALRDVPREYDTEMIEPIFHRSCDLIIEELENNPLIDSKPVRLTLDYYEDYVLLGAIRDVVGNFSTRANVESFLDDRPWLLRINEHCTTKWAERQSAASAAISNQLIKGPLSDD